MVPESKKLGHPRPLAEMLWLTDPVIHEGTINLLANKPQARTDLALRARRFDVTEQRFQAVVGIVRQTGTRLTRPLLVPILHDQAVQSMANTITFRMGNQLFNPVLLFRGELRKARLGRMLPLLGRSKVIRLQAQIGTHPAIRAVKSLDFVAPETTVLLNQLVPVHQLGCRRLGKPLAGGQ